MNDSSKNSFDIVLFSMLFADSEKLKRMLSEDPSIPHWMDKDGSTMLHRVANLPNFGDDVHHIVVALLEHGANPNVRNEKGMTPLHYAASRPEPSATTIAELLLDNGADPDLRDESGRTPKDFALLYSTTFGNQMVNIFEKHRKDTPVYDLSGRNTMLEALLGDPTVDEKYVSYSQLYEAIVSVLREGGSERLFNLTWHPQRLENVPFILQSPGLKRKLEALSAIAGEASWLKVVRAEIANTRQDNPYMAPETLLHNPLYVWGGAVMDGLLKEDEIVQAGRFVSDLIAAAPQRFDKAQLIFQSIAIGHLVAQYVPDVPVDRFVKLCASAGFHFEIQKDSRKLSTTPFQTHRLIGVGNTPIETLLKACIESDSIYLADRRPLVEADTEEAGRASYLHYLAQNELTESQVLPIMPKLDADQESKVSAILLAALLQGHGDLVRRVEEASQLNTNKLLILLHRGLIRRLREGGAPVPYRVFAGVYPTNSFNAHVVALPDLYLTLINTGVFELLGLLNGLFVNETFGSFTDRVRLAAKYIDAYCEHRILPEASDLARTGLGPEFFSWQFHLVTAAEEFALAHELGHVACGHAGGRVTRLALAAGRPIAVAATTATQENDADLWALAALTTTFGALDLDRHLVCSGILFFLATAALVEAALAARGIVDDTHPPALHRYFEMRYALAKAGLDHYTEFGEYYRKFALQVARELALDFADMQVKVLVTEHVANLVKDGLQEPLAIEFPCGSNATRGGDSQVKKYKWRKKLWKK